VASKAVITAIPNVFCIVGSPFRILIVEDEPLVAADLEAIVTEIVSAIIIIEASVAATKKVLHEAVDFAFLDVDVTNGKTFEIAQSLERKRVPFVFITGSPQEVLPAELRTAPFIPKPILLGSN
jgi:DNA-binding LytR/AlgR family response regulator